MNTRGATDQALRAWRWVRRGIIFVLGASVTLVGVVLVFTPGPALVVLPVGLMILATEFAWARVLLQRVKAHVEQLKTAKAAQAGASAGDPAPARPEAPPSGEPVPPPPGPTPETR